MSNAENNAIYVSFHHGALCDAYEEQANAQGFTLGDKAQCLQDLEFCLIKAHIHDLLTDSEYNRSLRRLQKKLISALSRLSKEDEQCHADDGNS